MEPERLNTRWKNYRHANSTRPQARERELRALFQRLRPAPNEYIWEVGTGNGYLTIPIAQAVTAGGMVVTTDVEEGNIVDVEARRKSLGLAIKTILLPVERPLLADGHEASFDAIASIATLHHFDNRAKNTGESGRRNALSTFYRMLKPGGRIVVADVMHDTAAQRYFDSIDNPRYCAPHGHPHDFFTLEKLAEVARESGFVNVSVTKEFVPWTFSSPEEARSFVHTIHNAICTPEESFARAQEVLGFSKKGEKWELGWELFYLTAQK